MCATLFRYEDFFGANKKNVQKNKSQEIEESDDSEFEDELEDGTIFRKEVMTMFISNCSFRLLYDKN